MEQLIAAIGVITSLFYLAAQIRQDKWQGWDIYIRIYYHRPGEDVVVIAKDGICARFSKLQ